MGRRGRAAQTTSWSWTQWDSIVNNPHHVYISPYDSERHVWVVEIGGSGVHEQILKFTKDGSRLVMHLRDPNPQEQERVNQNPGPLDFGWPSTIAFLPDGSFSTSTRTTRLG